jgi:hypothetical protein
MLGRMEGNERSDTDVTTLLPRGNQNPRAIRSFSFSPKSEMPCRTCTLRVTCTRADMSIGSEG